MTTTEEIKFDDPALSGDAGDEGDDDLVLPPRRSGRVTASTAILALCAVGCIGFAAGVVVEKKQLPSTNPTRVTSGTGPAAAGGGTGGAGRTTTTAEGAAAAAAGGPAGGAGAIAGQISRIEGTTLFVTDSSGNVVRVTTSPASAVTRTGAVSDVQVGDYVTVQGTAAADGSTLATRIVDTGSTPGAGGARAAGGPTGTGPMGTGPAGTGPAGTGPAGTGVRPGGPGGRPTTTVP